MREERKEEGRERGHTLARWPVPTIPTLPPAFSIVSLDISLIQLFSQGYSDESEEWGQVIHSDTRWAGRRFGAGVSGPGGFGIMFIPLPVCPAI
jgi:hypothetical protein